MLFQISYTLGCHYFAQGDLTRAKELFVQCHDLLTTSHGAQLVNRGDLSGFLTACGAEGGMDNLLTELEAVKMSSWEVRTVGWI